MEEIVLNTACRDGILEACQIQQEMQTETVLRWIAAISAATLGLFTVWACIDLWGWAKRH